MCQDENDNMYYIIKNNGIISVMEGSPKDCYIANHYSIFDLKASFCRGFGIINSDTFFLMDDFHTVYKLVRNTNNR